ncbi:ribose-5-phosphate isomerase [Bacteroidia bacterium]|nr:ribose-5-phosphate isomerase [Bacteroidia bacterium]
MNKNTAKIFIAADHRGVGLKLYLLEMLSTAGYLVENLGADDPNQMVDFPEIAARVANRMADDADSRGILICGTGAGVMIAANRYRHIRASRVFTPDQSREDRFHDDINVIAISADEIDPEMAMLTTLAFLESEFDAIPRRIRRLKAIS